MIPSIHIARYGTRAGRRVILTRSIVVYDGQRSALLPEGASLALSIDDAADVIRRGLARDPHAPAGDARCVPVTPPPAPPEEEEGEGENNEDEEAE